MWRGVGSRCFMLAGVIGDEKPVMRGLKKLEEQARWGEVLIVGAAGVKGEEKRVRMFVFGLGASGYLLSLCLLNGSGVDWIIGRCDSSDAIYGKEER
jgi:hypothetical protein